MTRLGDGLLDRLVPKTTAAAAGTREYVNCYCADAGSPPPANQYPCQWIMRYCDATGNCTGCNYVSSARCCT